MPSIMKKQIKAICRILSLTCLGTVLVSLLTVFAYASVTPNIHIEAEINHQIEGLISGQRQVTIRIYNEDTLNHVWEESHDDVLFSNGFFGLTLGLVTPFSSSTFSGTVISFLLKL